MHPALTSSKPYALGTAVAMAQSGFSPVQHAPAEATGVAGGILQMVQRIAVAVCL
ncbi:hypothetical protein [Streptomyces monashensis]|uniref:hypothetical protein n=1 Tax=Streptomyces monashensis TaxID=1678012 RepID=UPI001FE6AAF4|nr:hypothetical protein [Streptomyces monashensis]